MSGTISAVAAFGRVGRRVMQSAAERRVRRRLRAAQLEHATTIQTFTTSEELRCLLYLADRVPPSSEVVEIGSYLGASTAFLWAGLAGRSCMLTCIDTWNNETMPDGVRDTFAEFERNMRPALGQLKAIRKRMEDITPDELPQNPFFVFIDGDHSLAAARRDFAKVAPRVPRNGVIAMHDTLYYRGVSIVLGEALATGEWRLEGSCNNLAWIRRAEFAHGDAPTS